MGWPECRWCWVLELIEQRDRLLVPGAERVPRAWYAHTFCLVDPMARAGCVADEARTMGCGGRLRWSPSSGGDPGGRVGLAFWSRRDPGLVVSSELNRERDRVIR